MAFEYIWGYGFGYGKTIDAHGRNRTEARTRPWIQARRQASERPPAPLKDPVRTCPAAAGSGCRPAAGDPRAAL